MRVAILSDIHGNSVALDAVLADMAAAGSVDEHWVLGDLVALGPDPVGVMQRLRSLPNAHFIRGNTDRWLVDVHAGLPLPAPAELPQQTGALANLIGVRYGMVWAQGAITATGDLAWFAALSLDYTTRLPDGTRVLCVHAAPGNDDGPGIRPVMSDDEIAAALQGAEAELIFVGHTHWALDRTVISNGQPVRVVNLGSVSLQVAPDLRASYVLLEADASGHHLQMRKVEYDHQRVIEQANTIHHPAQAIIAAYMNGQRKPVWEG